MPFRAASTFERVGPSEHAGEIDAAWAQGRGAYGGLVAAILARALEADAPREHSLATLTAFFVAPATAGAARVRSEIVRAGRNVSTMRASLERDGVLATSLATLARRRDGLSYAAMPAPRAPDPEGLADGPEILYAPVFAPFFEFRQCLGPRPFEGGSEARVGGWCRLREEAPCDAALVCALLDSWPPAAASIAPEWCPVASIEMTVHFLARLPADGGWMLFDATSRHVAGGLAEESATLWSRSGEPIATCRQLVAIFPPA